MHPGTACSMPGAVVMSFLTNRRSSPSVPPRTLVDILAATPTPRGVQDVDPGVVGEVL